MPPASYRQSLTKIQKKKWPIYPDSETDYAVLTGPGQVAAVDFFFFFWHRFLLGKQGKVDRGLALY